jgi:hypothetical protein
VGCCDDQAVSFGVGGFKSDERSDIPRPVADASSVSFPFATSDLFFIIKDNAVCDLGVFIATVCDEKTMLFTMSGFVDCGVTGVLEGVY